ncbi:M23 family metallopeptidase [Rhodoflexus sp.]
MEKKTIYDWLSHRMWLVVRDEETLAPRFSTRITLAFLVVIAVGLFSLSLLIGWGMHLVITKIQGESHSEANIHRQIFRLSTAIDSLAEAIAIRDRYINDLQMVMRGETPNNDIKTVGRSVKVPPEEVEQIDSVDAAFRAQFEMEAISARTIRSATYAQLKDFVFFTPIKGVLLGRFDPDKQHYGVDIVARKNEPIKAIADGTVIISSWTQDSGYTIGIQHKNQLISFYKHNSVLLRKVGDNIRAGDIIAIIGNSGELTDGPHLHFELWHNGSPVNPEQYISF